VGNLSDRIQQYTQHGGVRPFGVSMLIAGVDGVAGKLLTTDPSGSYRGYKARALGRNADAANKLLDNKYVEGLSLDEAIRLAIEAIKTASGDGVTSEVIKVAVIPADTKVMKRLTAEEVAEYM
jgi:proteasome alpha subunit